MLERERGFEPPTLCLGSRCSTPELFPLVSSIIIVPETAGVKDWRSVGDPPEAFVDGETESMLYMT